MKIPLSDKGKTAVQDNWFRSKVGGILGGNTEKYALKLDKLSG